MTTHIKLYGSKADRFEVLKEELTRALGYEPSNPEVIGQLMAYYVQNGPEDPSTRWEVRPHGQT